MSLPSAKKRKIFDGRYEVISIVGRGLDSVVYHARHLTGSQDEVALKVLLNNKPKSSVTERLRKEALTLVSCRHKYVVRLDDFHSVAELCYLSMEYAPLGDLRKYLSSNGAPLAPERGATFLRQALEGIEFIHATGVLHRDLKPDNILVISEKEIRLADFGLALLPGDELDLEELQNGVGSLAYLPPELLDGEFYDHRSDLYSLGVCFYEALAGFHPFEKAPLSEQKTVRHDENIKPLHEINPQIPKHVSLVVSALMRYSPDQRFQSAMEAIRALSDPNYSGEPSTTTDEAHDEELGDIDLFIEEPSIADKSTPSYSPENEDEDETDEFTTDFDAFFKNTKKTTSVLTPEMPVIDEPASGDTEEMTAMRVQQLVQQEAKTKAAADAHRGKVSPPHSHEGDREDLTSMQNDRESLGVFEGITSAQHGGRPAVRPLIVAKLLDMNPIARPLVVGGVAALFTVGVVLLSHIKSSDLLPESSSTAEVVANETAEEGAAEIEATDFPHIPAGTYAGSIEGLLPGTTSPLALISRPGEEKLVVIIGVEGWTPSAVSTRVEKGTTSSTIIVRSNGVILNMIGSNSPEEVTGTFSNAITGESGIWSARKIS